MISEQEKDKEKIMKFRKQVIERYDIAMSTKNPDDLQQADMMYSYLLSLAKEHEDIYGEKLYVAII